MVTTKITPRFYKLAAESSLHAELNRYASPIDNSYPSILSLDDLVIDCPMVEQFIDAKIKKQIKKIFMFGAHSYLSSIQDECLDFCSAENAGKLKKILSDEKVCKYILHPQMIPGSFENTSVPNLGPGIFDNLVKLCDLPNSIESLSTSINGFMASKSLTDAISTVNNLNLNLNEIAINGVRHDHHSPSIEKGLKWLWENKATGGFYFLLLLLVCLLIKNCSKKMLFVLILIVSVIVYQYHSDDIKKMWQDLISRISGSLIEILDDGYIPPSYYENFEPQSFTVGPIIKGLMCMCFVGGMHDFKTSALTDFFEMSWLKVKNFPTRFDSLEKTFHFYSKMVQDTLNSFCELLGTDKKFAFATDLYPDCTLLVDKAERFLKDCRDDDHLLVSSAAQMCNTFETKITSAIIANPDPKFYPMRSILTETRVRLRNLASDLELRGAGKSSTRVPPIAYMFAGQPNLGKSYFMTALTFAALGKLYKNVPAALEQMRAGQDRDFWYSANLSIQHWEGYHGQLVVQIDDVGMQKDVAGVDPEKSELHKLIRMINDSVYPLPMANLELKGKVEFDSAVLLCTTNRTHWHDLHSITKPSAFARRFTGWDVSVCSRYSQAMTDGDDHWEGVMPIDDLRVVLEQEGKNEEEINDFIRDSMFLEFRKRVTIKSTGPGYVDSKIYNTHDVIDCLLADLAARDGKKQVKSDHRQSLIDKYVKLEPQARFEGCPCNLCNFKLYPVVGNDSEHLFWLQDQFDMQMSIVDNLSPFVRQGWDSVTSDPVDLGSRDIPCFEEIYGRRGDRNCSMTQALFKYGEWLHKARYIESRGMLSQFRVARVKQFARAIGTAVAVGGSVLVCLKALEVLLNWAVPRKCRRSRKNKKNDDDDLEMGLFEDGSSFSDTNENFIKFDLAPQSRDLNAKEIVASTTYRNTYYISDSDQECFGFVTFVHDCIMAIPQHYLHRFDESGGDYYVYLERLGDGQNCQRIYIDVRVLQDERNRIYPLGKDADLVFILIKSRVLPRQASLISKVFVKAGDWVNKGEIVMPLVRRTDRSVTFYSSRFDTNKGSYEIKKGGKVLNYDGIVYRVPTTVGDCGLPVAIQDSNSKRKLFGIHVAGSGNAIGLAVPITEEMILSAINEYSANGYSMITAQSGHDHCVFRNPSMAWEELEQIDPDERVEGKLNLGRVEPPKNAYSTNIRPSPMYKKVAGALPITKPARLRPFMNKEGVEIDPEANSMSKYSHGTPLWDLDLLDTCVDSFNDNYYNDPLFNVHPEVGRKPLDYETAVRGITGVDGFDGLKRSTSAGYPECTETCLGGKRDFFGTEGDYVFGSDREIEMRASVDAELALAKQNIRTKHACRVTLKDERRPKEKVDAGKTRSIFGAPLKHLIMSRMMFGAAIHAFQQNRIRNGMCIGLNVYTDADELVNYLGPDSKIIAGDFSSFDGYLPYFLMTRFTDTIDNFYNDKGSEDWNARQVIFEDICNSRHVDSKGRVVEWVGSNSSGNFFTSYLNSWCNCVALRYATVSILGLTGKKARDFLMGINNHVKFATYGDDNLIAVQKNGPYYELLTQDAYTVAFARMGWTYTDENKSGGHVDQNRKIGDVSFLKRSFLKTHPLRGHKYMMALALPTILEMIQWKKKKDFYNDDVKRNCINALQELSQHERPIFDRWREPIMSAAFENMDGFIPFPNTYDSCQKAVISRGSEW